MSDINKYIEEKAKELMRPYEETESWYKEFARIQGIIRTVVEECKPEE